MDKSKQKKVYPSYNHTAIDALVQKYQLSKHFIRASIRGDRTSKTSLAIAEDYITFSKQVEHFINKQ